MTEQTNTERLVERVLIVVLVILLFGHLMIALYHAFSGMHIAEHIPWISLGYIFTITSLIHGSYLLGWRRALVFFIICALISFTMEFVGEATGLIFGRYYYTDYLGVKLFGRVPLVIPLIYFMAAYPVTLITDLIIEQQPISKSKGLGKLAWLSFIGALIMTAWDLTIDPLMVDELKAWVWVDGGIYFGVPAQNFAGWALTVFLVMFAYRLAALRIPLKPMGRANKWLIAIPIIAYASMSFGDIFIGDPPPTRLISPFVMGFPVLVAFSKLADWKGD